MTEDRIAWADASAELIEAHAHLTAALTSLPMMPDDGICTECGSTEDWEVQESGYTHAWRMEVLDFETISAYRGDDTDGGDGPLIAVCVGYIPTPGVAMGLPGSYCGTTYRVDGDKLVFE